MGFKVGCQQQAATEPTLLSSSLQTFLHAAVGLPAAGGGIVVAGVATYLLPAARQWATGSYEDAQHRGS